MMKKMITLGLIVLMGGSTIASAQDDVSIMDLKETVYLLLKDVQSMKAREKSFINKAKDTVNKNSNSITAVQADIDSLKAEIEADRKRDVLSGYKVSQELKKFVNK